MRTNQRFDARGGAVEARRQGRDFVASALGDALVQRAFAERFDAALQRLEPARQPPHHWIRAGGDGGEQHASNAAIPTPRHAAQHRAARTTAPRRAAPRAGATRRRTLRTHQPQACGRLRGESEARAARPRLVFAAQIDIGSARCACRRASSSASGRRSRCDQSLQRRRLLVARRIDAGGNERSSSSPHAAKRSRDRAVAARALVVRSCAAQPARDQREQQQRGHHREARCAGTGSDGLRSPAVASLASCFRANT